MLRYRALQDQVTRDMPRPSPILPAHIEDTVRALAELHQAHHRRATPFQRAFDRTTKFVGRPRFVGLMTAVFLVWIGLNLLLQGIVGQSPDPAPFNWLQDGGTILALYITVLILITQRRENELTVRREQLTLELAILAEQKTAKIIELLEELRRDHPQLRDRVDAQADAMAQQTDPHAVLKAINETHEPDDAEP